MTKIAVIGGGASGLACAIELLKSVKNKEDVQVTILERLPRIGKKILVTGNGRCNLTNINATSKNYRGDTYFTEYALNQYSPQSNIEFFNSLGLYTRTEDEGRVYPLSNQASSVLDALRFECARLGVEIVCDYRAVHLKTVDTSVTTASVDEMREIFSVIPDSQVKKIGKDFEDNFQIRVGDDGSDPAISEKIQNQISELLAENFGANNYVVVKTDFIVIKKILISNHKERCST